MQIQRLNAIICFLETSVDRERVVDTNLLFNIFTSKLNIAKKQENQDAMPALIDNHVNSSGSNSKVRYS